MGPELGHLYHELEEEVDWLQQKWNEFRELFGKGQERIDMLATVASNFFFMLHKLMFEDAMLHLCRLTDPPATKGRRNLTFMALTDAVTDPALKIQVAAQLSKIEDDCEFAREPRNRRLAHADLELFRNETVGPKILSEHVEDALKSMRGLLGLISQRYGYPPSVLLKDPFGAQSLIYYLESGARAEKLRRHF